MRNKAYNIFAIFYVTFSNIRVVYHLIITAEYKILSEFQRNENYLMSS
jgi:hypothetical protein